MTATTEIERKFLVAGDNWRNHSRSATPFKQAYLNSDPERTVRVRIEGDVAMLTIKGKSHGISRLECEYPIPVPDAEKLLAICETAPLEKTRYLVEYQGHTWEVDEFHGTNQGLVVAEIELEDEKAAFARPDWLGQEVSGDARYYNSALSLNPWREW